MGLSNVNMEGYFDFLDKDDIRIKGTRVGIETILDDYMNAFSPEEIAIRYPTLTLEQVYATITYYLRNKDATEKYLRRWRKHTQELLQQQITNPTAAIKRLRDIKRQRQSQVEKYSL